MTGDLYINGHDAYTWWGLSFEDGAYSALLTPAPMKEYVENKSRLRHGKTVMAEHTKIDERSLTLPFHITASSENDFLTKYGNFCSEVLAQGVFSVRTKFQPTVGYRLVYDSCTQFRQFMNRMAVFSLKATEPDPTNRDAISIIPGGRS